MPVIEAQCASILVPHDHRHINQNRSSVAGFVGAWSSRPGTACDAAGRVSVGQADRERRKANLRLGTFGRVG
jgi:hypothetical protein